MAPDPQDNDKNMEVSGAVTLNDPPMDMDDELHNNGNNNGNHNGDGLSSGEDESDMEDMYNAYKPLAQDDMTNGYHDDDDDWDDDSDVNDDHTADGAAGADENGGSDDNFADFTDMETISARELDNGGLEGLDNSVPGLRGIPTISGINYDSLHIQGVDEDRVPSSNILFPAPVEDNDEDTVSPTSEQIDMNDEQAQRVREAMVGFSLPSMNIPDWARGLSDDEWKTTISTIKKPDT